MLLSRWNSYITISPNREKVETVADFIFLGSKVTAYSDCSHKIKRHLLLGRKAMKNLDSILKSRDITLLTKVHIVRAMIFPVVMYECESWTISKAECWRIDAFELWCWRRLLRVSWTARRSNQSILKEISPEYSLEYSMDAEAEAPILWPPVWRADSLEKNSDAGKDWKQKYKRATEGEMVGWYHQLNEHESEQTLKSEGQWRTGKPGVLCFMGSQRVRRDLATEQQRNNLNFASRLPTWCKW